MSTLDNPKIRTYLVAGNGFDIALGLKTKYSDFFMVIGLILAFNLYQNYHTENYDFSDIKKNKKSISDKAELLLQEFKTKKMNIFTYLNKYYHEDINNIPYDYYKKLTEIALKWYTSSSFDINDFKNSISSPFFTNFIEKIFRDLYPYLYPYLYFKRTNLSLDELNRSNWLLLCSDLSSDEKYLEGFIAERLKGYHNLPRFIQILHNYIQNSEYQNWMDLESFIELLVTGNEYLKSKFGIPKDSNSNAAPYLFNKHRQALEYSEGLEEFCLMFEKYISLINKDTLNTYNVDDLTAPYQNSFQKRNKGEDIKLLDISKVDAVFSYNYTDTFDKLFPKLSENSCIYYINGKVLGDFDSIRTESQIVFGYTRDNKKVDVSPKCLIFEKDKQRFLKNIPMYNYNEVLGDKPFNIVIFGHSCSPADGDVFRTIFNNPKLNKAVICCYDKVSMTSAYENLVKLLDESPSCNITINDLIINKKVLFCLNQNSIAKINITTI